MFQQKTASVPSEDTCVSSLQSPALRLPWPRVGDLSALYTPAVIAFLVATRWALAPRHLFYFDSANFALALEKFDPALHQPQPPGYPLFVALSRFIHLFVARPEQVFLIAGLLAACAAIVLIRRWAEEMFGRAAGILAAALLVSNPAFWYGGITNEIRIFLALAATGVGLLAWRALSRPREPRWFYASCAALGIAAGFRPVESALLSLALVWVWFQTGRSPKRLLLGGAALAAVATPWLAGTVYAVGGIDRFTAMLWQYAHEQFSGTSAVFGAAGGAAVHMFAEAVVWNFVGALVWLWAVPLVRGTWLDRRKAGFLAVLFLPSFLFSAFIHIGDPDQALASVSVLAVAGAGVLAAFATRRGVNVMTAASAAILLGSFLFFFPPGKIAKASSYRAAAAVNRMVDRALDSISALQKDGPLTIVDYGSSVASRQISYYFPDDYVVVLPGSPANPAPDEQPQVYFHHAPLPVPAGRIEPLRPGSRAVVCLLPWNDRGTELPDWEQSGSVYYREVSSTPIQVGRYTFLEGAP